MHHTEPVAALVSSSSIIVVEVLLETRVLRAPRAIATSVRSSVTLIKSAHAHCTAVAMIVVLLAVHLLEASVSATIASSHVTA